METADLTTVETALKTYLHFIGPCTNVKKTRCGLCGNDLLIKLLSREQRMCPKMLNYSFKRYLSAYTHEVNSLSYWFIFSFQILSGILIKIKFHWALSLQIICRENCFYWGWITIQARQSTASGPQIPRGPVLPRSTLFHLLFGNLIKCKFVWEYALFRHSIGWTDGGLSQSAALLSALVSLLWRDSGPFTQQLVGAHDVFLPKPGLLQWTDPSESFHSQS